MKLSNAKVAGISLTVFAAMLGLGFSAEPLYGTFCRVTGYGGTTRIATSAPKEIVDQTITVRFDTNVADVPLEFRPLQRSQDVKIGQHGLAFFEVSNPTDQEFHVIAAYNVTPHYSGKYFNKLECFCFTERIVKAGETKKLPVVFFISPDLDRERNMDDVRTITLSYTFYQTDSFEGAANSAALN